jgi:hypothetical protein
LFASKDVNFLRSDEDTGRALIKPGYSFASNTATYEKAK